MCPTIEMWAPLAVRGLLRVRVREGAGVPCLPDDGERVLVSRAATLNVRASSGSTTMRRWSCHRALRGFSGPVLSPEATVLSDS